jgi:acetolactate synthase-1/2/3 large subunit
MQTRGAATTVGVIASALRDAGVRLIFGFPGGGSNLDMIAAAEDAGIRFVLTHSEAAAGFMAATSGELTGRPGVCLATLGPGAANLVNPAAHAFLDRAPMLLITDRHPDAIDATMLHQRLDHRALFASVTKGQFTLDRRTVRAGIERAIALAMAPIPGPVHLDLPADEAAQVAADEAESCASPAESPNGSQEATERARAMLKDATRPIAVIGLGAADPASARAAQAYLEACGIPFLTTYKGKGVLPDDHPLAAGIFTGGAIEREVVGQADRILTIGLDPVELIPRPWGYEQPVVSVSPWPMPAQQQLIPSVEVVGPLPALLPLLGHPATVAWDLDVLAATVRDQRCRLSPSGEGLAPHRVVQIAGDCAAGAIAAVDAGAHMFPATTFWTATAPRSFLMSNGLATMGYAVPAGICAALLNPERRVVVFTGDGGMLMTVAELSTAVRLRARLTIVVFDDRSLSLIKIKQRQGGESSTAFAPTDWRALARSLGLAGFEAATEDAFSRAFAEALAVDGPSLVAAKIDPSGYAAMLKAIRG